MLPSTDCPSTSMSDEDCEIFGWLLFWLCFVVFAVIAICLA